MPDKVVVVEDDVALRSLLVELLEDAGESVVPFATGDSALAALGAGEPADLVVTDLMMPGLSGRDLLQALRSRRPELNVVVITAFGSIESAIELVKAGAYDYLTKPVAADDLLDAVRRALAESRARRELSRRMQPGVGVAAQLVGSSSALRELLRTAARFAHARHAVLITGEAGTGKEVVARALHGFSGRAAFVPIRCGAVEDGGLEPQLLAVPAGATLFLDEVGALPPAVQPKLLRWLEQGEARAGDERRPEVRLVASTSRALESDARTGAFRDDLYWRLNVLHLHVPPLRERPEDIPILAEYFLRNAEALPAPGLSPAPGADRRSPPRRLAPEAVPLLVAYPWPGNVRELRNAVEQAATVAVGDEVGPDDLPPRIRESGRAGLLVSEASQRRLRLRDLERSYILDVVQQTGGNKSRAAEILGLDRKTLYRKLEEYRREDTPAP
ncbi:MAG TPA: sigma-54 dependent transcriptional regulator [Gemmatimonadales bacterium]|nr:sigma-54 dependent transcriptional regulator [Gemmatimonadales bacterium]